MHRIYSIDSNGIISNLCCGSGKEFGFEDTIPVQGNVPSVLLKKEDNQSFSTTWYSNTDIPDNYLDKYSTENWFKTHAYIDWLKEYYQWNGDSFTRIKSIPVDMNN